MIKPHKRRPRRLVVFDWDGTVVDSQANIAAAVAEAWKVLDLGPAPDRAAVRRVVGLPLAGAFARLLPEAGPAEIAALVQRYRDAFATMRRQVQFHEPMFPGVVAALDALDAAGLQAGVATGKSRRGLDASLAHHDLARRFVTLQTGDTGPGKPHPDMLLRAMAEAGCDAGETVMIGDTSFDMEMARSAGTMAIGVGWGYHEVEELEASGAAHVLESFADLADALSALGDVAPGAASGAGRAR